jgi:hypothetical protein
VSFIVSEKETGSHSTKSKRGWYYCADKNNHLNLIKIPNIIPRVSFFKFWF